MNELRALLKLHYDWYPKMQIIDAVKLIYQNEFGGGHLIPDESVSLAYLKEECAALDGVDQERYTDIGNGMVRFNLRNDELNLEIINRIFVLSANNHGGDMESFKEKLNLIYELPFDRGEIDKLMKSYCEAGYPMVRHSDIYRENYNPAYRVIEKKYVQLIAVCGAISSKINVVFGIDGMCGSGKSTIAGLLRDIYDCDIIHMDDFFLPPSLRTEERMNEIGGNIHYERFREEVADKIKSGKPFEYRVFDCSIMDYSGTKTVNPQNLIIVEGSYSLHPMYDSIYDLELYIEISAEVQKQRILARDGEFMWDKFENIWIPMENRYFSEFKIATKGCFFLWGE